MRMSEKCRNNSSDNPLTSRRTDRGKNLALFCAARGGQAELSHLFPVHIRVHVRMSINNLWW